MNHASRLLLTAVAVASLSACAYIEKARDLTAKGVAEVMKGECALTERIREENLDAINAVHAGDQSPIRGCAIDCNGDGLPDFGSCRPPE